jgi:TonB family protein
MKEHDMRTVGNPRAAAPFVFILVFFLLGGTVILARPSLAGQETKGKDPENLKLIKKVEPVYPDEARKAGIEGLVVLEGTIDTEGNVSKVKVLKGENESLNKAAAEAVKQWKYKPAILKGKPMPVNFTVTVKFSLNDKESGAPKPAESAEHPGPKPVKKVSPTYPEEARKEGIEGTVILEATIDAEGNVAKVKVLKGEIDSLNKAAVEAIKQWKYEPVIVEGKAMPSTFTVTMKFALDKDKKKEEK